ncbi:MAG: hypothetical protein ACJ74Y_11765 [Bryobacteraceae bacterium]
MFIPYPGILKPPRESVMIVLGVVSRLRNRADIDEPRYPVCVQNCDELMNRSSGVPNSADDRFLHFPILDHATDMNGLKPAEAHLFSFNSSVLNLGYVARSIINPAK